MISIHLDVKRAVKDIDNVLKQQLYATEKAINETQFRRRERMQHRVTSTLNIRQAAARRDLPKAVRYDREDRASRKANRFTGQIRIVGGSVRPETELYKRYGGIILRHDEGGQFSSNALYRTQNRQFTAGGFVIPAPGLRSAARGMPRSLYPAQIGLSSRSIKYEDSDDPQRQYKGGKKKRGRGFRKNTRFYFVKENVGIFVRTQVGKESEYDAVWFFRRQINIRGRLELEKTYQYGLAQEYRNRYGTEFEKAMRSAK
ncbi:MAG TPA: hypothetical protein DGD08_10305 [Gemmatimonas aurantiaca]|uniref:Uncharacterized protein n=2 Tax=Gemmatimonas aurantiaca TaxID=173480 RepID=C1A9V4_GEMAT|nr:hypothetical protein [Gemmatimonas aurantiaca]BAH39281.1 hypothetical protein GAU_2239 [Gemmatimonas aurantiaca T-27]HCT57578.1 hypothetical protein [Gemmatimonas aurantiaca]